MDFLTGLMQNDNVQMGCAAFTGLYALASVVATFTKTGKDDDMIGKVGRFTSSVGFDPKIMFKKFWRF